MQLDQAYARAQPRWARATRGKPAISHAISPGPRNGFDGRPQRAKPAAEALQARVKGSLNAIAARWRAVQHKRTALAMGVGTALGVWAMAVVLAAIDRVPLLPDLFVLVGTAAVLTLVPR
jgi:hypothetical protein